MKRNFCLVVALAIAATSLTSCRQLQARSMIKDANSAYAESDYARACDLYKRAADKESFPELERVIGYCLMGQFQAGDDSAENLAYANEAAQYLSSYLEKNDDITVEEVLVNLYLNSNQTEKAIERLEARLGDDPDDTNTMKSIANLLATLGEAEQALDWYRRVAEKNPSPANRYTIGVVAWEMVDKGLTSSVEESLELIELGKTNLAAAIEQDPEYFDALVYINLLYRQEANFSDDFEEKEALIATAEEYRQRAIAIAAKRAAEAEMAAAELGLAEDGEETEEEVTEPAETGAE